MSDLQSAWLAYDELAAKLGWRATAQRDGLPGPPVLYALGETRTGQSETGNSYEAHPGALLAVSLRPGITPHRPGHALIQDLGVADSRVHQAFWEFWALLAAIPEVRAVTVHKAQNVWIFRTYIERRDILLRHRIYEAEDAVAWTFPDLSLDFYVFDVEGPGRGVETPQAPALVALRASPRRVEKHVHFAATLGPG